MKPKAASPHATLAEWTRHRAPPPGSAMAQALAAVDGLAAPVETELTETLTVLDALGVDHDTLAATVAGLALPAEHALAHDPRLATLVEGQREAERIWALHRARGGGGGAEGLRRLLLAIIRDLRVVFILLARQLVALRGAARLPDAERRALAELTADVHAPLANRLGIWQVKWEMEDLAFRFLQPDVYKRIATLLDERRDDRERYIGAALTALTRALTEAGLRAEVAGRPKHIYSIWKKMQRKNVAFEHLYDVRALRLLVDDVPACYAALGVVHSLWPHVPGEFWPGATRD